MNNPEKNTVVISGVNGFVGGHLSQLLHDKGLNIIGIGMDDQPGEHLDGLLDAYYKADLSKEWPVEEQNVRAVIHLAGLAAVGPSFDNPQLYIDKNSAMVTNLCEYYLASDQKPRIVLISSGAIYDSMQTMPISEGGTIGYNSPYAVSKVLNENQAKYYRGRGLDCVVARPFNHIGPGQGQGFILPDLYARMVDAKGQGQHEITVGNIETKRDYTDVRDIVAAYALLALSSTLESHTYNVCSGESLSGRHIFETLSTELGIEFTPVVDQNLVRPNDIMDIRGDSGRLQDELGWKPHYDIEQTIKDFIDSKSLSDVVR